ncbi:uncharacterized protein LOC134226437 [Armigeres subalbatus]|uniref:uncharacterized protein LOC134226437 n=1 Tax=Armigeres subalbatus TaxID=124917 RepID=UPI002ED1B9EA
MEALNKIKFEKGHRETVDEAITTEAEDSAMELEPDLETEIAAIQQQMGREEYIEEEMLIFADFENHLAAEDLSDANIRVKVIGIDSDNPVIQINDDIYRGSYDFALGTNVFLEEDEVAKSNLDPLYSPNPPKMYKYSGKSNKVIKMKRIFATPKTDATIKTEPDAPATEESRSVDNERCLVTRSYEEALNLHLPLGGLPPRRIGIEQNFEQVVHRKPVTLTRVDSDVEDDAVRDDPRDLDYKPGMDA